MKIKLGHNFEEIIGVENLLEAWQEFVRGKRAKRDVQEFSLRLMNNIFSLHQDLANHTYKHGAYQAFKINDPKPRDIHKASVRDRLLHHAVYRKLYPFFERVFIADSFSCRLGKGTHKAINRFRAFAYKVGKNNTKTCWILKCDIKKFFASIDHKILKEILAKHIADKNTLWLLDEIIDSFRSVREEVGLPLGNLTSQLLVNIYMNEFDRFVKHKLKAKFYIRYADDFILLSDDRKWLEDRVEPIKELLKNNLKLEIHENKIQIKTLSSGVDFLGWVHFPDHRVLRTKTKKRMFKRITVSSAPETMNSYLGLLKHGNTKKIVSSLGF
ncbi:MAG: hypothetical protein A2835_00160 [Candidatus Niyogibacteria bacterium RIFCSPHIGHO2_01_FULL_45_28]|nr:MAG: hypothetical protein A2835_00160 [Candidatus Niyogibacteria bacterium RIFCSPHIGHO2_01_FULL_45_28]